MVNAAPGSSIVSTELLGLGYGIWLTVRPYRGDDVHVLRFSLFVFFGFGTPSLKQVAHCRGN
jgi:hypothetical protein